MSHPTWYSNNLAKAICDEIISLYDSQDDDLVRLYSVFVRLYEMLRFATESLVLEKVTSMPISYLPVNRTFEEILEAIKQIVNDTKSIRNEIDGSHEMM